MVTAALRPQVLRSRRAGPVVGIGVDAVDVARFRRILARRPGFAARFFTETEQADARRSPDPTESLAARFAAKEAVMKALGTGLGGFALTDVEVRRGRRRRAPPPAPPRSCCTARPPRWRRGARPGGSISR